MKEALYFESHPWDEAVKQFLEVETRSDIAEVTIQCVCIPRKMEDTLAVWDERLSSLLGSCTWEDRQKQTGALAILRRYESGAIVRLFMDEAEDCSENFEISGRKALVIWRPDSRPQAHMVGSSKAFCDCAQVYSIELEGM